jgi:hypothetical protein
MKKYFVIALLASGCFCSAQQLPRFLQTAVDNKLGDDGLKPSLSPQLPYYSKNYNQVFGKFIYSIDAQNFGDRHVYVSSDKFYFNNINFISDMALAGQFPSYNFNDTDLVGAVLSVLGGRDMTKALSWSFKKK